MKTSAVKTLNVSSHAFEQGGSIPEKYTCDGRNMSPPLRIKDLPEGTQSLALVVDDPDAPMGTWDHWIVWNINPVEEILENSVQGIEGINSFRQHHYGGPCPPSGTHRYFFKVYALDLMLKLNSDSKKSELLAAMEDHILAYGELMGTYRKK